MKSRRCGKKRVINNIKASHNTEINAMNINKKNTEKR